MLSYMMTAPTSRGRPTGDCRLAGAGISPQPVKSKPPFWFDFDRGRDAVAQTEAARAARKVKITDDLLREVADIYRATVFDKPTETVAEHFDKQHRTAALYIKRARERGFLGPAIKGKAGEQCEAASSNVATATQSSSSLTVTLSPASGARSGTAATEPNEMPSERSARFSLRCMHGSYVEPTKQTITEFATEWLAAIEPTIRPSTHYSYAGTCGCMSCRRSGRCSYVALTRGC